jgi:hypothetical protein
MHPGERVTMIRQAAETLAPQGWTEIDLVLDQFGFPTDPHEWGVDSEHPYVVAMLKDASDDKLACA